MAEDTRGKRNAIRLHEAYTVETVVVADSDMVQYHGAEAAQRFLLTVMNMVRISNKVFTQVLVSAPQSRLCLLHIELPFTQSVHTQVSSLNPLAAPCSLFLSSYGLISDAGPAV